MKYPGCVLEFTDQRNKELLNAFRQTCRKKQYIDVEEISCEIVNSPCSRFWVSEERAMIVINAMFKGKNVLCSMRPTKREMFLEIYRRILSIKKTHPNKPLAELVVKVVNSPAPKFYMVPRSAMEIIYKIKKGFYKDPDNKMQKKYNENARRDEELERMRR